MTSLNQQANQYLEKLFELLRIPSISTLPEHAEDMKKAVQWLRSFLIETGFAKEKIEELYAKDMHAESNHPVLYAERIDNPQNPTILIYGHYDVQPVDPIHEWVTPPFEPEVRNGNIYGRGTTDDKGQMFTHLAALHAMNTEWDNSWPVNIKLLLEGEEEAGGENIEALLLDPTNKEKFKADYCLISDTGFVAEGYPTIEYGLRGIAYMQIDVKLSDGDLHSGLFGGGVQNPANALATILAELNDAHTNKMLIPGIYDDVADIDDDEREKLKQIPFSDEQFLKEAQNAHTTHPEAGFSVIEATAARPSLDINGIWSGFTGEGAKTIIAATAHAKVSIRTVPNQNPHKVAELFESHVTTVAPRGVSVSVHTIHVGHGALIDIQSTGVQLASEALEETFGAPVTYSRSGGSIPIVALIQQQLNIDPILIGYGLPDDALHSPNEKMSLEQFNKGIECNMRLYTKIAEG